MTLAGPARSVVGTTRFVRYAFMPNRLRYCGGDDNSTIFQYALEQVREPPLIEMLRRFTGAVPYLRLIGRRNGIADPFDERVVEAYWIGNSLLENVEARELYDSLRARYAKALPARVMDRVAAKAPAGARPHHSFHVLDVWRHTDRAAADVLATLDSCRVSWGVVRAVDGAELVVDRRPLTFREGKLVLGAAQPERVTRLIEGRGFATEVAVGHTVSLHWGWVCERLDARQAAALERYTLHHIAIANQDI